MIGRALTIASLSALAFGTMACGRDIDAAATEWAGTIDTLATGTIVVTNPVDGAWREGEAWTVTEDLRIGAFDDPGPDSFGQVVALDVDAYGRIWVLESQANELRVFDADGRHVRTVGGKGGGPGEFAGPAHGEFGPDGNFWIPDPQNSRISVIDTTGAFVVEHRMPGGFFMTPWPGGFDHAGRYYMPVPLRRDGEFGVATVRYDLDLNPLDTLPRLMNPNPPERFELVSPDGDGRLIATVPFSPGLWQTRSPQGNQWGVMTGEYLIFEVDAAGDTVRKIQANYDPLPVTDADLEAALEGMSWFVDQGGKVDPSKIPSRKPAAWNMFVDDAGYVWVNRMTSSPAGRDYDVFDPSGRFLGSLELPVPLSSFRRVVGDDLYGTTTDELGVPYVVRLRIQKGSDTAGS